MTAPGEHPFGVLGIAPTLDPGAVKRGYFTALQKSPPHADPAGFRRIREAYERLSRLDDLFAAYMSSPPVIDPALADLDANIGQEMSRLAHEHAQRISDAARRRSALDALSRLTLSDAQRTFGAQPGAAARNAK
jgi:hypothetical protein